MKGALLLWWMCCGKCGSLGGGGVVVSVPYGGVVVCVYDYAQHNTDEDGHPSSSMKNVQHKSFAKTCSEGFTKSSGHWYVQRYGEVGSHFSPSSKHGATCLKDFFRNYLPSHKGPSNVLAFVSHWGAFVWCVAQ